jgi:hypothetical protein
MPIGKDSLIMNGDPRITILQQKYVELNKIKQSSSGYRVQIHFGNEREKAKEIKTKFFLIFLLMIVIKVLILGYVLVITGLN